jgi:Fungal protein kinase
MPAVIQTLDHMRMNLAFRPFQRWVFGLLVCGTDFYVLYVDRAGGFITPTKNIQDDSRLFVRVILHMSNVMTRSQLGQDPDVEYGVRNEGNQTHPWDREFPIYTFPDFSGLGRRIETIGRPLFVASGMLGGGTSVWNVKSRDQPTEYIMKYSHRSVKRKSESQIYAGIQKAIPNGIEGVCEFVDGDDTVWNEAFQRVEMLDLSRDAGTVINPRRDLLKHPLAVEQDRVVHRLRLNSRGESLVCFKDVQHLTDVLISALKGEFSLSWKCSAVKRVSLAHKELTGIGILHGDISAGNILIRKNEDGREGKDGEEQERTPGLLADMELAKVLPGHDPQLTSLLPSPDDAARPGFTVSNDTSVRRLPNSDLSARCISPLQTCSVLFTTDVSKALLRRLSMTSRASFGSRFGPC